VDERLAIEVIGHLSANEVENRGRQVRVRNQRVDAGGRNPGANDDEWYGECRVVGEQSVRHLAMLAERLAVIRGDDDERPVEGMRGT
jgi:hypothetical protein